MKQTVTFGVDVGGTQIKFGIFDQEGHLLNDWAIDTNTADGGSHIMQAIALSIESVIAKIGLTPDQIEGVGMGVPGPVLEGGVVVEAANLGWKNRNVKEELEGYLSYKVRVANDANVAALGEQWAGSAKGKKDVVMVTLGTGVGGGIVLGGQLLYGSSGAAGEIGHMCVNPDETVVCNCGKCGCLEQYTSATGMVRLAKEVGMGDVTAKDVWDAVKAGDEKALQVAEIYGQKLGFALANVASVINPEIYIVGGGVSKAGNILLEYIEKYYNKYVFAPCKKATFTLASLGNQGGIYGAARLVLGEEH